MGDILNMISITLPELKHIFRKFNPVERMMMDRSTGKLNEYFNITKSQLIDLYYFCVCDKDVHDLDGQVLDFRDRHKEDNSINITELNRKMHTDAEPDIIQNFDNAEEFV